MADPGSRTRRVSAPTRRALALLALASVLTIGAWLAFVTWMGRPDTAPSEDVVLAYRTDPFTPMCHLNYKHGTLVAHAPTGVAIAERDGGPLVPILWPAGFTARRFGTEIEILNESGKVIAVTGNRYKFDGGTDEAGWRGCDGVHPALFDP